MNNLKKNRWLLLSGVTLIVATIIFLVYKKLEKPLEEKLGLQAYYKNYNIYQSILKDSNKNISNESSTSSIVNPYVDPQLGWIPQGKPLPNPTKVASNGLYAILNGELEVAKQNSQWLLENSVTKDNALFFPFQFDFAPYYPYSVKAPWNSGLTQGLALGLFTYLYKETTDTKYLKIANQIYSSYKIPIEEGGFTRFETQGPFFEEYPTKEPTRVLNGTAVAILALHDYAVITNNHDANKLFQKSVARLALLIPQYETQDSLTGTLMSTYSLATRPEVLGRFVGSGNILISQLKLIGINNQTRQVISSVYVDKDKDTDVNRDFYLYINKDMNWGEVTANTGGKFRNVNGVKRKYNHSPFQFVLALNNKFTDYEIEVSYKSVDEQTLDLQLFDETEYWKLGTLVTANNGQTDSDVLTQRFRIPTAFIESWRKKDTTQPKIDEKYLDDNQILVNLIGEIGQSKTLTEYAQRWQDSISFVPSRYFNNLWRSILINPSSEPTLGLVPNSSESTHVEYPSVIKIKDKYFMYYSAYGDDKKWRIFLATSDDGIKFHRQGWVFNSKNLPTNCQGNQAFPFVVKNTKAENSFFMYFSCASQPYKPYESILWAHSADGWNWKYGGVAVKELGLDPLVISQPNGEYTLFYTNVENGKATIKKATSINGTDWLNSSVAIESSPVRGFYTLSGLLLDKRICLLLESTTYHARRHDTLLYCDRGDGRFSPSQDNPVMVDKDWEKKWDTIRYGFNIVPDNGKYIVYHNVIPALGAEIGGQIARSELDIKLLKSSSQNLVKD